MVALLAGGAWQGAVLYIMIEGTFAWLTSKMNESILMSSC